MFPGQADVASNIHASAVLDVACNLLNLALAKVNNREFLYLDKTQMSNLDSLLPKKNWILFAIADLERTDLIRDVAKVILDHGVLWICGAGEAASEIDTVFDLEIVDRKIEAGDRNYDDVPITTWHDELDEGLWFATTVASDKNLPIDTVVCINLSSQDYQKEISELIDRINKGWLPGD